MKKYLLSLVLSLLFIPVTVWGQNTAAKGLSSRLDTLIKYQLPVGSNVGISIYDLTDGKSLYTYQADKLSRPASTMKLLTTITALSHPDADDPFKTEVWYQGVIEQDTLKGDLYVVGGYDPEFDDEALDSLVNAVSRFPFSVISGHVYGDVSMKDSIYWGSGWAWDDTPASYQPYLSPLMLNKGLVTVTASPGERGHLASLDCVPASSYYTVTNETKSRTPAAGRFGVSRDWLQNGNNIVVKGNVEGKRTGMVNIYSSRDFFMHTFLERLCGKGITTPQSYGFAELPRDSVRVERMACWNTSVQKVLNQLMKESDNLNAEAFLCRLGAQATGKKQVAAEDGIVEIMKLIRRLGHDPKDYKIADGCGLSNYNYLSPALLVDFLKYAYSQTEVFQMLYKSLPVGGVDGTLKFRMKGTPAFRNVHAKTGSFTAINALAGYLKMKNGHEVAFAIMNQNVLSAAKARAFQDKVCEVIIGK
mgnify:CR=1 FL=1